MQLNIQYKNSPIIDYTKKSDSKSPQPGERAPDVKINGSKTLYNYLNPNYHNILIFAGDKLTNDDLTKLKKMEETINHQFSDIIKLNIITKDNAIEVNHCMSIPDNTHSIYEHYHIKNQAIYLVRPDYYIAYCHESIDFTSLEAFLKKYLII